MIDCLCVTKGREVDVRRTLSCWQSQVADCRLVLVHEGLEWAPPAMPSLVLIDGSREHKLTLGELRNLALGAVTSEFWCQFDDDDWHHPERLSAQLARLGGGDVCLMSCWTVYDAVRGLATISGRRNWEGSILARSAATQGMAYPALPKCEDMPFIRELARKSVDFRHLNRPELYVYRNHGENTWDQSHFDRIVRHSRETVEIAEIRALFT